MAMTDDIPVAHTPPGGYGDLMPPPILGISSDPLPAGVPDLRGVWTVVALTVGGELVHKHPVATHVERIEQQGDRVVVTTTGVIHDMRADGTEEHGVHDVGPDFTTPVNVVAAFENSVLVLRPINMPGVEVRRWLEGDELVWDYAGAFTARMKRS